MERGRRARARVVVLSDFGRSPKRQYHALPLANQALLEVDIVAYGGPEPHTELLANPSIHIHLMKQWSTARQSLPKIETREGKKREGREVERKIQREEKLGSSPVLLQIDSSSSSTTRIPGSAKGKEKEV
ncbi:uncharacterized protein LOC131608810 isoform X8 [Vicia villosa]|uniref:uncharacterized protein LOC131608810 isoform X8 n=1 Tax=Vicia villosa TaxID=3911 RepID=UPI00273CAF11|nr:uncharacterized protein LOC131608810 isoform X8 [Vicia villosa]